MANWAIFVTDCCVVLSVQAAWAKESINANWAITETMEDSTTVGHLLKWREFLRTISHFLYIQNLWYSYSDLNEIKK